MLADTLLWFAALEVLSWSALVIAWPLWASWPDRGLGLSKCAGPLFPAIVMWLLCAMGFAALAPVATRLLAAAIIVSALVATIVRKRDFPDAWRTHRKAFLVVESTWLAASAAFVALRGLSPAIVGGEKLMDFAFLNAAIRSSSLPLHDPWMGGVAARYYYFGYLPWAAMSKALVVAPAVAYNLAVAAIAGSVAAAVCSIVARLSRQWWAATASAFALVLAGTPAGARQFVAQGGYDSWAPTRVIPGTINEFPFFTFFWGDLHPHLLAMPNLLLFVALVIAALLEPSSRRIHLARAMLLGTAAGVAAITSPWDLAPIAIAGSVLLIVRWRTDGPQPAAVALATAGGAALVVAAPALARAPAATVHIGLASMHSPIGAFVLVQGLWILPAAAYAVAAIARDRSGRRLALAAASGLIVAMATRSVTPSLLAVLLVVCWRMAPRRVDAAWTCSAVAIALLLLAELCFVDDVYGRELERMNLVFKLHLHAAILLALAWWVCMRDAWAIASGSVRTVVATVAVVACASCVVFPVRATATAYRDAEGWTLDGAARLARTRPGDAAVLRYLASRKDDRIVLLEATGPPYSWAARISSYSGVPAILGWANHERVWRRDDQARAEINRRAGDVRLAYEGDADAAAGVLETYGVSFVVVGDYERQAYPGADFAKFERLGRRVVDVAGTRLFAIDRARTRP
ncbi:MAG: DUF2298 domain-containing protein [Vicinamibacterales bacterium]